MSRQPPEHNRAPDAPGEPERPVFPEHQAYLLRLWRTSGDAPWRASLHSVRTGDRHMFGDLVTLFAFLLDQAGLPPDGRADEGAGQPRLSDHKS